MIKSVHLPLQHYRVKSIDRTLVRGALSLWLRTIRRGHREVSFVMDPGSAATSIPVELARKEGLVIPERVVSVRVETAIGMREQRLRQGRIQGHIVDPLGWDFDWPCHFVEHAGPPPKAVVGLAGVLDDLRITFDGAYSQDAPYGLLILERRR